MTAVAAKQPLGDDVATDQKGSILVVRIWPHRSEMVDRGIQYPALLEIAAKAVSSHESGLSAAIT